MSLNFKVSKNLVKMMDKYIDEVRFRSRGQILNIALEEWLNRLDRRKQIAETFKDENDHPAVGPAKADKPKAI